jgi:hypothetical protein
MVSETVKTLVQIAWPLAVAIIVFLFYRDIKVLLQALLSRVESDESIKLGAVEFRGTRVTREQQANEEGADVFKDNSGVESREATEVDFEGRKQQRYATRFARLVHRVLPTGKSQYPLKVLVYIVIEKILPGLDQDKGYVPARINDINFVEYYLGKYYGSGKWGNWFIVRNAENKFAIEYFAEDNVNCIARVHFNDGKEVELVRYVDLEMANVILEMDRKLRNQAEKQGKDTSE